MSSLGLGQQCSDPDGAKAFFEFCFSYSQDGALPASFQRLQSELAAYRAADSDGGERTVSEADAAQFYELLNGITVLAGLDGQVFLDETDDTYCVWRTEFDAKKRLCFYGMDIFRLNVSLWDRSFEEHIEYAYEPDELALWLEEAGFTHIRQYGDRVLRAPKQDEQRIYFSAKKD